MMNIFKKLFLKPDSDIENPRNSNIIFVLSVDKLDIGNLEYKDDKWIFRYSEAFRNQNVYNRLVGFSDLTKEYTSRVLWPFFKIRIPGLKQPMIQEVIKAENLNVDDEASLLKRFGRSNISNPYILELEHRGN